MPSPSCMHLNGKNLDNTRTMKAACISTVERIITNSSQLNACQRNIVIIQQFDSK